MTQYFQNPRLNKAAYILATMSPDMVSDIVSLVNERGSAVLSDLARVDGPPKFLGMLSSDFVSYEDFPELYMGLSLTYMAAYRQPADKDFYERILMDGAGAPAKMAAQLSSQIETWDPITTKDANGNKVGYIRKKWLQIQEQVRQAGNWFTNLIGSKWENDQNQAFDTDRLYEFKLLGRAVNDLASRSRLVDAQVKIREAMGVTIGDVVNDPVDVAEAELVAALRPLTGAPVPISMFGKLANFVKGALKAHEQEVDAKLAEAGITKKPHVAVRPEVAAASDRIATGSSASITPLIEKCVTAETMGDVLTSAQTRSRYGHSDAGLQHIADTLGDDVASSLAVGDVASALDAIIDEAADEVTTGDPGQDEEIITSTLNEIGDEYDGHEIGGILKRARINQNIKRGRRAMRQNDRRAAKADRREARNAAVTRSKKYRDNAMYQSRLEEELLRNRKRRPVYQQVEEEDVVDFDNDFPIPEEVDELSLGQFPTEFEPIDE